MTNTDVIALFTQDALACPPSIDRATTALSEFVARHHLSLSPVDVEILIGVGGQLIHQGADEWWNSTSVSMPRQGWQNKVAQTRADTRGEKHPESRRSVSLHESQMMVINRQRRYSACENLVFDAAYWKRPERNGTNWDIEPMPLRGVERGGVPYDCFCVMESYFYYLRARFDVHASEEKN